MLLVLTMQGCASLTNKETRVEYVCDVPDSYLVEADPDWWPKAKDVTRKAVIEAKNQRRQGYRVLAIRYNELLDELTE